MASDGALIAFCHVAKVGGTTLAYLLRRHFGLRHVDLTGRRFRTREPARPDSTANPHPYVYGPTDLRNDLRFYPRAESLAGHLLMPCVDYGEFSSRLVWYTFLRDPIARFRSTFLHEVEGKGRRLELPAWAEGFVRHDMTTRKIAGELDLDAAKQLLDERMAFVGLHERYDHSLVLMRDRLGLRGFRLAYPVPMNTAAARVVSPERQRIRAWALDQLERHADVIRECNWRDIALYEFAERTIWTRQVAEYGGEERLADDAKREVGRSAHTLGERLRIQQCFFYRKLVVEPYLRARLALRPPPLAATGRAPSDGAGGAEVR